MKVELLPNETPREMAKRTGKPVVAPFMGCMVGVYYPFRNSGDLYVAGNGIWHCCQCDKDVLIKDLDAHIDRHGKQHKNHKKLE